MKKNSAELIATNEDLLMEILLRLPIKPLLTFKRVSKQFLHLISSPYFSKKHTKKNPNLSISGLFMHQNPSLTYLSLYTQYLCYQPSFGPVPVLDFFRITPYATNLTIISYCNGLLLCLLVLPNLNNSDIIYFISNPTTKISTPLPQLELLAKKPIVNMDLAYDPRESLHYKVICIRHLTPPDGPDFEIEIFSSESGFWRICQGKSYNLPSGIQFQTGIYWKNSLHYLNPYSGVSCYFRIGDETLRSLPMPPMQSEIYTEKRSWYMGQSGGHLHLVDIQKNIIRDPPIDIYELMDDYSGWVLKFRVELGLIGSKYPEMVHYIDVIQLVFPGEGDNSHRIGRYYTYTVLSVIQKEGEEDFMEIVMSIPHKIICYNPRDNTSKVLVYFGDDNDRIEYEWNNVVQYTETLLPV